MKGIIMNNIKNLINRTKVIIAFFIFSSLVLYAQNSTKLTDPEIASVAVTANQIDVDYGQIALKKSDNTDIKKFAQSMINDHNSIIQQAVDLAGKLGVTPKDNAITQQLLKEAKQTKSKLNDSKGKSFDKAYIDNEVAYHEAVISTVKNVLIPQTQNEQLKNLLIKVAPLLDTHLEMAKKVQKSIE